MCKKIAVCTAALVAAASVGFCFRPVPVYADYVEDYIYQWWLDNKDTEFLPPIYEYFAVDGEEKYRAAVTLNAMWRDYIASLEYTCPSNGRSLVSGWYLDNGTYKIGTLYKSNDFYDQSYSVNTGNYILMSGEDFDIYCTFSTSAEYYSVSSRPDWSQITSTFTDVVCTSSKLQSYHYTGTSPMHCVTKWYTSNAVDELNNFSSVLSFVNFTDSPYLPTPTASIVGTRNSIEPVVDTSVVTPDMDLPNFTNSLHVYMVDTYGEQITNEVWITPPEIPPEPIYPTGDYLTGMPKDWTVENPVLPTSPQMSIDVPDASLPDLSGLSQYTDGVGFWWSLTGWIMDTFGIREIVLLLIGLGVFAFLLYRLGAG